MKLNKTEHKKIIFNVDIFISIISLLFSIVRVYTGMRLLYKACSPNIFIIYIPNFKIEIINIIFFSWLILGGIFLFFKLALGRIIFLIFFTIFPFWQIIKYFQLDLHSHLGFTIEIIVPLFVCIIGFIYFSNFKINFLKSNNS